MRGEFDCLHANKHQRFLQVDTFNFVGRGIVENRAGDPGILPFCFL